jgi:hypothetical protein
VPLARNPYHRNTFAISQDLFILRNASSQLFIIQKYTTHVECSWSTNLVYCADVFGWDEDGVGVFCAIVPNLQRISIPKITSFDSNLLLGSSQYNLIQVGGPYQL